MEGREVGSIIFRFVKFDRMAVTFLDYNAIFEDPAMWLSGERILQTEETSKAKTLRGKHA